MWLVKKKGECEWGKKKIRVREESQVVEKAGSVIVKSSLYSFHYLSSNKLTTKPEFY